MPTLQNDIFNQAVKMAHQLLKPLGYKKKGNNFYRLDGEIGCLLSFQRSMYNDSNYIRFTLNIALDAPKIRVFQFPQANADYPSESECIIRLRIGQLLPEKQDYWYEITPDTDEETLCSELKNHIEQYIIPYFAKHGHADAIAKELSGTQQTEMLFYALVLNDRQRARTAFLRDQAELQNKIAQADQAFKRNTLQHVLQRWQRYAGQLGIMDSV